jgi:hypothetical protein
VQGVIGRVLKLVGITARKQPGTTCARLMQAEIVAVLADFQAAEKLLQVPDGKAAIAGDEATKIGRSRFALGFFASADGPGSPILFARAKCWRSAHLRLWISWSDLLTLLVLVR